MSVGSNNTYTYYHPYQYEEPPWRRIDYTSDDDSSDQYQQLLPRNNLSNTTSLSYYNHYFHRRQGGGEYSSESDVSPERCSKRRCCCCCLPTLTLSGCCREVSILPHVVSFFIIWCCFFIALVLIPWNKVEVYNLTYPDEMRLLWAGSGVWYSRLEIATSSSDGGSTLPVRFYTSDAEPPLALDRNSTVRHPDGNPPLLYTNSTEHREITTSEWQRFQTTRYYLIRGSIVRVEYYFGKMRKSSDDDPDQGIEFVVIRGRNVFDKWSTRGVDKVDKKNVLYYEEIGQGARGVYDLVVSTSDDYYFAFGSRKGNPTIEHGKSVFNISKTSYDLSEASGVKMLCEDACEKDIRSFTNHPRKENYIIMRAPEFSPSDATNQKTNDSSGEFFAYGHNDDDSATPTTTAGGGDADSTDEFIPTYGISVRWVPRYAFSIPFLLLILLLSASSELFLLSCCCCCCRRNKEISRYTASSG
eukprot:GEZU01016856.1.p1 GENE.GEZU01016856.1~~GEZU01016856.1.p1  ORF type:complete len:471 (-),score=86.03 GEZU01016856.1:62-1474(-)